MNVFKMNQAFWLGLLFPLLLSAKADTLLDSTLIPSFYADSTACQAWVSLPVLFDPDCPIASYLPSLQIDLDIQDINIDGQITPADVVADLANPEDYFRRQEENTFFSGNFPIGQHVLYLHPSPSCSDTAQMLFFSVLDTIAPKPKCKLFIEVEMERVPEIDINQDGRIDLAVLRVSAFDLLEELSTDCTGQIPTGEERKTVVDYSVNELGAPIDRSQDTLVLTCPGSTSLDALPIVQISAWDEQGNSSFCYSRLYVTGSVFEQNCTYEPADLSIDISTINGDYVPYVDIQIQGDLDTILTTNERGHLYMLRTDLDSLTIRPRKNSDSAQGLTEFDIVLLQRHIIGSSLLSDSYRLLAADVNQDGRLSIRDVIEMRRIILGIQDTFINNNSWRFFDRKYPFANPASPWEEASQAESVSSNDPYGNVSIDFVGVKIGDLN
ncbi:MAG: hypothetical protein KTR30_24595 [Saprospiraceae bacterium]|nr:hypothetical protein [Saprospiraceae bacterium]